MEKSRIFVVDDDENIGLLLKISLEKNFEVVVFLSGEEALGAINRKEELPPALLVTDLHMTGMSGEILIKELKSIFPEIPTIIASGDFGKTRVDMADAICPKPFDLSILFNTIERLISKNQEPRC